MCKEMIKLFSLGKLNIAFCYFLKQLKNLTDRLDQRDIALRAFLEEINRTFSIKVHTDSWAQLFEERAKISNK